MSDDWKADLRRHKQNVDEDAKRNQESEAENEQLRKDFFNKLILLERHILTVMEETGEQIREVFGENYKYKITTPLSEEDTKYTLKPLAMMVVTKHLDHDLREVHFTIRYDGNLFRPGIHIAYGISGEMYEEIDGDDIDFNNLALLKELLRKPILEAIKLIH